MNICRYDKVVLMKEMGALQTVGETYEVANITETAVILRDAKTKIAVGACNIDNFDMYFEKPENVRTWTPWQRMIDQQGNTIAFYRTNRKKVQVRTSDDYRAEASCNKCDEFNLYFGLTLAYKRCQLKMIKDIKNDYIDGLSRIYRDIEDVKHFINNMVKSAG